MPYTKKNRNLYGGSQYNLNKELRRARERYSQAPDSSYGDFEMINSSNVPKHVPIPSNLSKSQKFISRLSSAFSKSSPKYNTRRSMQPSVHVPSVPVPRQLNQNNLAMLKRSMKSQQQYVDAESRFQNLYTKMKKSDKSKLSINNDTTSLLKEVAQRLVKSTRSNVNVALLNEYILNCVKIFKDVKYKYGGMGGLRRLEINTLKKILREQVIFLNTLHDLQQMKQIINNHKPNRLLVGIIDFILNNKGGSKDRDFFLLVQELEEEEALQLSVNIPDARKTKLVSRVQNKSKSKSKPAAVYMRATGKRSRKRKTKRNKRNRKSRKTSRRK